MDLSTLFRQVMGQRPQEMDAPPQAMTRVTRTPVWWSSNLPDDTFGAYYPKHGGILMNESTLPQSNPNPEYMSNILRHESVHALMPPSTVEHVMGYLNAHPQEAAEGKENLSKMDPGAGASVAGLTQEAPAYAVQGYKLGMDDLIKQYLAAMPQEVRQKYMILLGKYAPGKRQ